MRQYTLFQSKKKKKKVTGEFRTHAKCYIRIFDRALNPLGHTPFADIVGLLESGKGEISLQARARASKKILQFSRRV